VIPEYGLHQLGRVRQTCLHVASKLGDFLNEMVVVGGQVTHLLVGPGNTPSGLGTHPGTVDLDLGFSLALLDAPRYRKLSARLRDEGFKPDVNARGNETPQRWLSGRVRPVTGDFSPPGGADSDSRILHIDSDLAAIVTPGLELAFADRTWIELADYLATGAFVSRSIPVCGAGAFTALNAFALGNQTRSKDAYDFFYVWNGFGIESVAGRWIRNRFNSLDRGPGVSPPTSPDPRRQPFPNRV
jgi:hypothetical protein